MGAGVGGLSLGMELLGILMLAPVWHNIIKVRLCHISTVYTIVVCVSFGSIWKTCALHGDASLRHRHLLPRNQRSVPWVTQVQLLCRRTW